MADKDIDYSEAHELALTEKLPVPEIIGSTSIQLAFIPSSKKQMPVALGHALPMTDVAGLALKMRKGKVRFQVRRSTGEEVDILMTPPELMMLLTIADRFITELPR